MAPSGDEPLPFYPVSMRFTASKMEEGFYRTKRPLLVRRIKSLAALHLVASACPLLLVFGLRLHEKAPSDAGHESYLAHAAAQGFMTLYMLLLLLFSPVWGTACSTPVLEVSMVLTTILSMSVNTFTGPTRFAKLQGYSLLDAFGDDYDSDSGILLILDIFVTGTHLGLPIRWFIMVPVELGALLFYLLLVGVIGSSEPATDVFYNVLCLTCLITCSALGKRTAELEERRTFSALISEKALRCEVEYQLSHVASAAAVAERDSRSEKSFVDRSERSEPETDRSGALFDPFFEKDGDHYEQLRLLAEKGEAEHWRISASELSPLCESALGSGNFGLVQRAVFCGSLVAVKQPHLQLGQVKLPQLCNELRVLRHLRHPHIVATHGAVVLPERQLIYLVLELIEGVDLRAFLLPTGPSLFQRYQVMLGVCQALLYMHTRTPHLVHGDLKDSNVLVTLVSGCAFPKVLDFGLSRVLHTHSRALGGTPAWMAPEVQERAPVRCSADVYSFGHLLFFSATSLLPPMKRRRQPLRLAQRPAWPHAARGFLKLQPLVQACLQHQEELRPSIAEVHATLLAYSTALPLYGSSEQASEMKKALEEKRAHCSAYLEQLKLLAGAMDARAGSMELLEIPRTGTLESLPEEEASKKAAL